MDLTRIRRFGPPRNIGSYPYDDVNLLGSTRHVPPKHLREFLVQGNPRTSSSLRVSWAHQPGLFVYIRDYLIFTRDTQHSEHGSIAIHSLITTRTSGGLGLFSMYLYESEHGHARDPLPHTRLVLLPIDQSISEGPHYST